ncbi:MAG: Thiamine-monophosphate kinase [Sodalis sp.]|nr:MAG: Thiamine-monophosphate kinase [Sodalis sp.]
MDAQDSQYFAGPPFTPAAVHLLHDLASAVIDIFGNIITDLRHILSRSDCGACINLADISTSTALLRHAMPDQALRWAPGGGED